MAKQDGESNPTPEAMPPPPDVDTVRGSVNAQTLENADEMEAHQEEEEHGLLSQSSDDLSDHDKDDMDGVVETEGGVEPP